MKTAPDSVAGYWELARPISAYRPTSAGPYGNSFVSRTFSGMALRRSAVGSRPLISVPWLSDEVVSVGVMSGLGVRRLSDLLNAPGPHSKDDAVLEVS